eukprot:CAMPEP_0114986030 /NCGR_PEP_ID=MMETSP0216-20121206/8201_1 /TAXON_ID=223996 /ORGANISM="Protocruzia adherens, Strain Boccale" /LENGTH=219 /DNA_ID=CAMNT_0002348423 /DNA_START=114 /DNA_END=773 /DNA_ORIENTATION=-
MCILQELQQKLQKKIDDDQSGKADQKWSPVFTHRCQKSKCPEKKLIFNSLVDYLYENICPSIDSNTDQAIKEKYYKNEAEFFSEIERVVYHPQLDTNDKVELISVPSRQRIAEFCYHLARLCDVQSEVLVYTMMLLEKFLNVTQWQIRAANWRPLVIAALRIAQKSENDAYLPTKMLHQLYPIIAREDAEFERLFLIIIDYNMFVSFEEYVAKLEEILQ